MITSSRLNWTFIFSYRILLISAYGTVQCGDRLPMVSLVHWRSNEKIVNTEKSSETKKENNHDNHSNETKTIRRRTSVSLRYILVGEIPRGTFRCRLIEKGRLDEGRTTTNLTPLMNDDPAGADGLRRTKSAKTGR